MSKTFSVVHNIASPYRLHLFRVLARALSSRGLELHVDFMARTHRDRPHWSPDSKEMPFGHKFWGDVGPYLRGKEWHLNPGMVAEVTRRPPAYLMVGGPWDSLTGAIVAGLAVRSRSIAWIEGNTSTPGIRAGAAGALKRLLLRPFDFIAVPGREGRAYAELFTGLSSPERFVTLPNLVEEGRFSEKPIAVAVAEIRRELGVGADQRLAIWNARLLPAKGVAEFLDRMTPELLAGWRVAVFGEGPERENVLRVIANRRLEAAVQLVPYWPYERMPAVYGAADLMLLPSMHDPNPLSIIEAMHAGLPLLVSKRIGNHPEAILEGENGWTVDPVDTKSVQAGAAKAFTATREVLRGMGEVSRRLARQYWTSDLAIEKFLETVL